MKGLALLSLPDLRALADALAQGRLAPPFTAASFAAAGFGARATSLSELFEGLDLRAARKLVDAVVAERERPVPRLELVWTGPEAPYPFCRCVGGSPPSECQGRRRSGFD